MAVDMTLRKSIELAVTTEKLGATFYETLEHRFTDDRELKELFSMLAKDEVAHERQFRALLGRVPAEEDVLDSDEKYQYLAAVSISSFFLGEKGAFKNADKIKTRDDALGTAFAFEKASLLYYQAIEELLGGNEILKAVIAAEKGHLVSVMKYLITGAKMRGLADEW